MSSVTCAPFGEKTAKGVDSSLVGGGSFGDHDAVSEIGLEAPRTVTDHTAPISHVL